MAKAHRMAWFPCKVPVLTMACLFFATASFATILPYDKRPETSAYISVGDCLWNSYLTPVGNQAGIEAVFDAWKKLYKVNRVLWRGMQDEIILDNMKLRHASPVFDEFYESCLDVYKNKELNAVAVEAAHRRGMKIWGYHALFDYGGSWEDGVFDFLPPYYGLDELIELHPEYSPIDKRGHRKGGGTVCFAYPEVRHTLAKRYTDFIVKYNFDGVMFMTYVENYSQRFNDEFGYNEPIVQEFKKRYGVDIRTQSFDKEAWRKLRGEYLTEFLKELRVSLNAHGKQLGMSISERNTHSPMAWASDMTMYPAGSLYIDWENWIKNEVVDELLIAPGRGDTMVSLVTQALDLKKESGSRCHISFYAYGAGPTGFADDVWNPVTARGAVPVIADGGFPADSGYLEPQPAEALRGNDPYAKMAVLKQMIAYHASSQKEAKQEHGDPSRQAIRPDPIPGATPPNPADIIAATHDANLLVRRKALTTIGKLDLVQGLPALVQALEDPETAVRSAAIKSMQQVHDAQTADEVLAAVHKTLCADSANFAFLNTSIECLSGLSDEQFKPAISSMRDPNYRLRMIVPRAIIIGSARAEALPGLLDLVKNDPTMRVRYCAAWALMRYPRPPVVQTLLEAMGDSSVIVQQRAAGSLPKAAGGPFGSALTAEQKAVLDALEQRFRQFDSTSSRSDKDWGWRAAGNALLECGSEGKARLERLLANPAEDLKLRQNAFFVLRLPQTFDRFHKVTEEEDAKIWQEWPQAASSH